MNVAIDPPQPADIYAQLGLKRVINAADTYTYLGGGALPAEVLENIAAASSHHVYIDELLEKVGERISQLLNVPAAFVTSGAAAGLSIASGACMAGTQPAAIDALPVKVPDRHEFISLKCQRNSYDRAILSAGGTLVEVGYADSTPLWAISESITEKTAGILYYTGTQFEKFAPPLAEVARIARESGVPLIVDSAAQFPPVSNLNSYLDEGADLVIFSGGKGIRGPQSSGLILGKADLIKACAANSYPHHSVGRVSKNSKENILGLLAAVERAVSLDWDAQYQRWSALLENYQLQLEAIPGVRCWIDPVGRLGQTCPRLFFEWTSGSSAEQLVKVLEELTPSVVIGADALLGRQAYINPFSVMAEEEDFLINAVANELKKVVEN